MKKRLKPPSPALVIAVAALFVALGGTGYAALRLPRNSVGTIQIRNGAVINPKIRNGTILGSKLKNGTVTAGKINVKGLTVPNATHAVIAVSAQTAATATTATTATSAASATTAGTATTASSPGTLASGKTETGVYDVDFAAAAVGDTGDAAITFPFPLAAAPKVEWIFAPSKGPDANCPGSAANPEAAAGYLCLYESADDNVSSYCSTSACGTTAFTYGALPSLAATNAVRTTSVGSWAVTAP